MKKVSRILLLVAGIYSLVCASIFIILGIVFLVYSSPDKKDIVIEGIKRGFITTVYQGTVEEKAQFVQTLWKVLGVISLVECVFGFINAFVSFTARKNETKPLHIINIVFGVISGLVINVVGAIFGMIALNRQEVNSVMVE